MVMHTREQALRRLVDADSDQVVEVVKPGAYDIYFASTVTAQAMLKARSDLRVVPAMSARRLVEDVLT